MTESNSKTSPPEKPSKRRFMQFSLRTLLLLTIVSAIALAIWRRPDTKEETHAGGAVKIVKQIRLRKYDDLTFAEQAARGAPGSLAYEPPEFITVLHGDWTLSDREGNTRVAGGFYDDSAHGWWTYRDPTGQKRREGRMEKGKPIGEWQSWYAGGAVRSRTRFEDGKRQGTTTNWWPGGAERSSGKYEAGDRVGTWTFHNAASAKVAEGAYEAGQPHGRWTYYDGDGELTRTVEYRRGFLDPEATQAVRQILQLAAGGDIPPGYDPLWQLGRYGPAAVEALAEALAHENVRVRRVAAAALLNLGKDARGASAALVKAVTDDDAQVRRDAIKALSDGAAGVDFPLTELGIALVDGDEEVRVAAAHALISREALPTLSLDELIAIVRLSDRSAQTAAAVAIWRRGEEARPMLGTLRQILPACRADTRYALLATIASIKLGEKNPPVLAIVPEPVGLQPRFQLKAVFNRSMLIWRVLPETWAEDIFSATAHPDADVRRAAVCFHGFAYGDLKVIVPRLEKIATEDANAAVRKEAIAAIQTIKARERRRQQEGGGF